MKKFDLITIGNALHWLDHNLVCEMVYDEFLQDDGVFAILKYHPLKIELNFP